ncbi:MAG: bifunctional hydroxymethylpyrimidine kinase/phosphomethylpyrimidine kinase [Acidobacteriota bacterium]
MRKVLLSIAGYDPTSGAGVIADIKTFKAFGFYGVGVVTSIVSQNSKFAKSMDPLPPLTIEKQIRVLAEDLKIHGIKIGIIGSKKNLQWIINFLKKRKFETIVLDPIIKASHGIKFLDDEQIEIMKNELFPLVSIVTPNLFEAMKILKIKNLNLSELKASILQFYKRYSTKILVKGGHLKKENWDIFFDGNKFYLFSGEKIKKEVHGTGCILSSSILALKTKGYTWHHAIDRAKKYVSEQMKESERIGKGQEFFR